MSLLEVRSPQNLQVKEYIRLAESRRYRHRAGKLALEGPHLIGEALAAGIVPQTVFWTRSFLNSRAGGELASRLPRKTRQLLLPDQLFHRMAKTESPQGVAAIAPFREPPLSDLLMSSLSLALLLDRVQDPGNMGTILRSAAAVEAGAVFYTPGCADPYGPKVLRSTAGALFHLPLAAAPRPRELLAELKKRGLQILVAAPRASRPYWEANLARPFLLVIGNESSGVSPLLEEAADGSLSIPHSRAVESLNAAVAAGVILFEALRQRGGVR